jgi:hypothetical protein
VTAHGRYIPRGLLDSTKVGPGQPGYNINSPNSISENFIDPRFYLDLTATRRIVAAHRSVEVFATVNNVFNKAEPKQLRIIGNPLLFDPIGRFFKFGIRTSL